MAFQARPLKESDVTPREFYLNRRKFLTAGTAAAGALVWQRKGMAAGSEKLYGDVAKSAFSSGEEQTTYKDATTYNNFYEFGTDKIDPSHNSATLKPKPWHVVVEGECDKPGRYAFEDLFQGMALEERIYRLRCVEAWSMVIPWVGFELGMLLKRFAPTSKAKFVEFETLHDPLQMPGQNYPVLKWPYREGLRIDEAMHPLTILAVGMYGEILPNQNGAPLRLVVPWKYGFKSIKSIVKIRFREDQPDTSWNLSAPHEYGFYSNVNPQKSHPRWSQSVERRIAGERNLLDQLFQKRVPTLMFNGYAEQVAGLYAGMDLQKYY